jgi:hypothetical protein
MVWGLRTVMAPSELIGVELAGVQPDPSNCSQLAVEFQLPDAAER